MPSGAARETLEVALTGGAQVTASLWLPPAPTTCLLCLPALGVPAVYYEPFARALAARGIAVAIADHRGNGTSSVRAGRGTDFGYAELVADAHALVTALRRRVAMPVGVVGHSLGGQVGALLAGQSPGSVDALALVACGTPYWRRFPRRTGLQVLVLAHLARVAGRLVGHFPGEQVGFGGREAARLMREWSSLARRGRLQARGMDAEAAFAGVRAPTLVVSIDSDWMAPQSSVDHLAQKLAGAPIERVHIGRAGADPRALDHLRWARFPDAVADTVVGWIHRAWTPLPGTSPARD